MYIYFDGNKIFEFIKKSRKKLQNGNEKENDGRLLMGAMDAGKIERAVTNKRQRIARIESDFVFRIKLLANLLTSIV